MPIIMLYTIIYVVCLVAVDTTLQSLGEFVLIIPFNEIIQTLDNFSLTTQHSGKFFTTMLHTEFNHFPGDLGLLQPPIGGGTSIIKYMYYVFEFVRQRLRREKFLSGILFSIAYTLSCTVTANNLLTCILQIV